MAVTFTTKPQYAAPGRDSFVSFVLTGTGNFVRGFYTDAPIGSEVKTQLLNSGSARIPAFVGDSAKPWTFKPDVGGIYTFQIEQYTKGTSSYGGGYQDSPDGFPTETLIETSTTTIDVGQKVTQSIGYGADTATLTLFVVGDTARATTFDQYDFTSPLISDAKTPKAGTAALNSVVIAAVTALADQTTTTMLGDAASVFNSIVDAFYAHARNSGSYAIHPTADNDNPPTLSDSIYPSLSPEGMKRSVTTLIKLLDGHMRNDDGSGTGTGSYHISDRADWLNVLLVQAVGSEIHDSFVGIADLWRSYEAHRIDTTLHTNADVTHVADALPPLLNIHRLFLAQLATQSPTAPPSVNPGVTALIHGAGFEEA